MDPSIQSQSLVHFVTEDQFVAVLGAWTHRPGPLYARLASAVADAVAQAALEPGTRLPAERSLADALDVSRGTVVAAYSELADRGVVSRRQGSGTTVNGGPRPSAGRHMRSEGLDRQVSGPKVAIDLSIAAPMYDDLARQATERAAGVLNSGDPGQGYSPLGIAALRSGVAERLTAQGTPTSPAEILITAGAQGALQLIISAFVRNGDRVIVESPTYTGAIELLSRAGAAVEGVVRDHAGPRADLFDRALQGPEPALALLVPTCHNPTGTSMSEQRRREILSACAGRDLLLVEDQTMAHLTFSGECPPSLVQMAPDNVIAIGSFSKIIWGGLRTGWIRADAATILRLGRLKAAQDMGVGHLDQAACVSALDTLDDVIATRRKVAKERHDVLREAISRELPEWQIGRCEGGYSLWIRIPHITAAQLVSAALQHGVAIVSGGAGAGASDDRHLDHVRICFAQPPDVLEEAVTRLRRAWEQVIAEAASPSPLAAV